MSRNGSREAERPKRIHGRMLRKASIAPWGSCQHGRLGVKRMSWRSSCSGIIFVAFANAGTAVAGDHLPPVYKAPPLPADRPFDWTGFYVGGSVGEHWGTHTGRVVGTAVVPVTGSGDDPFDFSPINHNAAVAGGQVGFNRQVDRWVFGAEGSFEHSPVKQTVRGLGSAIFLADDDFRFSSDWQASARVRAGIAFDRWLV